MIIRKGDGEDNDLFEYIFTGWPFELKAYRKIEWFYFPSFPSSPELVLIGFEMNDNIIKQGFCGYMDGLANLKVSYRSSPNIAWVKYWGKYDEDYIIPINDSLGLTLNP